jgi:hypothetical protein
MGSSIRMESVVLGLCVRPRGCWERIELLLGKVVGWRSVLGMEGMGKGLLWIEEHVLIGPVSDVGVEILREGIWLWIVGRVEWLSCE